MTAAHLRRAEGFGGGKVILFGEHGVVYGRMGLAAGVRRGVTASVEAAPTGELVCEPWGLTVAPDAERPRGARGEATLAHAFAAVLELYPSEAVRVNARIELPGGAGLGCSAAIGVAVMAALDAHFNVERSRAELAEASLVWERVFHGNPSGIDNAVSALGGVVAFRRGQEPRSVPLARPLTLVVGNSEQPSSTKEMVAGVAARWERDRSWAERRFDEMERLARAGEAACAQGELATLGGLMDENQELLRDFGLVTPRLDAMCAAARAAGALGAKVTGAGGGGCMVALAECETAEDVRRAIDAASGVAFVAEVDP